MQREVDPYAVIDAYRERLTRTTEALVMHEAAVRQLEHRVQLLTEDNAGLRNQLEAAEGAEDGATD